MNPAPEPSRHSRVREIFLGAIEKVDPAERASYLNTACGDDPVLLAVVKDLLQEEGKMDGFLEESAASLLGMVPKGAAASNQKP